MEPVLEVPQLPKDIWQRIARCMNSDTYDWKGGAAISSLCRATRDIQHDQDKISPTSLSELVWLVMHKPPPTHLAIDFCEIDSEIHWDSPPSDRMAFKQRLRDVMFLDIAPCLRNMRELHVLDVHNEWDDDTFAWLSTIMLTCGRVEVSSLEIDRFCVLPIMQQLNHLNIKVVKEVAATCSRSLQYMPHLETLRLIGHWIQGTEGACMRIDALNLHQSRHLHALSLAYIVIGGLTVPDACAVDIEGDAAELRRCWDLVRPLCSSCCLVIPASEAEANVAFLLGQACDRCSTLYLSGYRGKLCGPSEQRLELAATLRSLQVLDISCRSLRIRLGSCLSLRWLCMDVEQDIDVVLEDAKMLAGQLEAVLIRSTTWSVDMQTLMYQLAAHGKKCTCSIPSNDTVKPARKAWSYPSYDPDHYNMPRCPCGCCHACLGNLNIIKCDPYNLWD